MHYITATMVNLNVRILGGDENSAQIEHEFCLSAGNQRISILAKG